MNHLFSLGISALVAAVVALGVSTFGFSGTAGEELVAMRTQRVETARTTANALAADGLRAGDVAYDKALQNVERSQHDLRDANEMLGAVAANRSRWRTIALVAGVAGLALLALAMTRKRKVAPRAALA